MALQEPEIWGAIRFGSILENVVFDEYTREVDFMSKCASIKCFTPDSSPLIPRGLNQST